VEGRAAPVRTSLEERGSAPLEVVLLAIPVLAVMMLIVFVGRVVRVDGTLDGVAHYAALRAAQARSADEALGAARDAVDADLAASTLPCEATDVGVDTAAFAAGGRVEVRVTCLVRLSDLGPLRLPGSRTVTARSVAVVDVYRGTS
jgi:Flp pilus assembly protein TadG